MKLIIKNRFACIQIFTGVMLCMVFFVTSGCGGQFKSEPEQINYPSEGRFGPNILAEGFVAYKTEWARFEYSVKAETSKNSGLKIVIKSAKPVSYFCENTDVRPPCWAEFDVFHKTCPACGGVNTLQSVFHEWGGLNQGSDENWRVSIVGNHFTFTVYESGKPTDASIILTNDCIVEYYENFSSEPTKVKLVEVIKTEKPK